MKILEFTKEKVKLVSKDFKDKLLNLFSVLTEEELDSVIASLESKKPLLSSGLKGNAGLVMILARSLYAEEEKKGR
jgi:hypothetical protein